MAETRVKVMDLWATLNLMKSDKMKYVDISIDEEEGFISLSGMTSLDSYESIDYDPVEPVQSSQD